MFLWQACKLCTTWFQNWYFQCKISKFRHLYAGLSTFRLLKIAWRENPKKLVFCRDKQMKHLGIDLHDLVTLSIKYPAIVVETMKSVIDRHRCYKYRLMISANPRLSTGSALCLSRLWPSRTIIKYLSCHGARRSIYYFVKNLTVVWSFKLPIFLKHTCISIFS